MKPNAFIDKLTKPTDKELAAALGPAKAVWDQLVSDLATEHDVTEPEWNSYSKKAGWSLRLKYKKRVIVYLAPCRDCFRVAFVLGDKAVKVTRGIKLPARVVKIIEEAPRYAEGTGVRLEVKSAADIAVVKKLAGVKLEN
jgi:Protein of unknown function (DUF3788)